MRLYLIKLVEKRTELLIILQRKTNFLKKTLPYWKYWKKTERLQIFYLKQKKLLKKEARLSLMKPSPNCLSRLWRLKRLERLSLVDRP